MKGVLAQIYNGFLLRDLLGYVVPGSFVLGCLFHLISIINGTAFYDFIMLMPDSGISYIFLISLCYACGHFLSGVFFHSSIFRFLFKYSPKLLHEDHPGLSPDKAWAAHRSEYRKACDIVGKSFSGHIERHAALVHFTGHFSAGILFAIFYLLFLSAYQMSPIFLIYATPLLIVFPGIYIHYRRVSLERYHLERSAIEYATNGVSKKKTGRRKLLHAK